MELKKKRLVKHRRCRAAVRAAADGAAVGEDSSSQVGASVLGLSPDMGKSSIRRRIVGQPKARLPAFERKRFTRQSLDVPFGKTDRSYA